MMTMTMIAAQSTVTFLRLRHRTGNFVLAGAAFLAVSASAQSFDSAEAPPLAIVGVSVIDARNATTIPDATVVIADGRITNVEDGSVIPPDDAQIIDGEGKFLMPGLWDMHVHLSYARPSAFPALVANGVTAVRDMGSDLSEVDRWRTLIASDVLVGPTIIRAGPMLNGMEFNEYQLTVADGAEARTAVRTLHKIGVDFIKIHRRTSAAAFRAIADEARRLGLSFSGHIPMRVSSSRAGAISRDPRDYRPTRC